MTVYVDPILTYGEDVRRRLGRVQWCHLTADTVEELHAFAAVLGLRRSWFQHGEDPVLFHYDLTPGIRAKAVRAGAVQVELREMGLIIAARRDAPAAAGAVDPGDPMWALTVWRPWSHAIAAQDPAAKGTENRTWPTCYRGPLAIHAGQRIDADAWRGPLGALLTSLVDPAAPPPGGAIIAVAELVDCHPGTGCCRPWGEAAVWHWSLQNVRRLPDPVDCRGARRLWQVPSAEAAKVRRQLAQAVSAS